MKKELVEMAALLAVNAAYLRSLAEQIGLLQEAAKERKCESCPAKNGGGQCGDSDNTQTKTF